MPFSSASRFLRALANTCVPAFSCEQARTHRSEIIVPAERATQLRRFTLIGSEHCFQINFMLGTGAVHYHGGAFHPNVCYDRIRIFPNAAKK